MATPRATHIRLTRELLAEGLSHGQIAKKVRKGELFRISRGVYTTREPDDLLALQALARAHPDLVFTGRTAAFLYGQLPMTWPAQAELPRNRSRDLGPRLTVRHRMPRSTRAVYGVAVATPVATTAALLGEIPDWTVRCLLEDCYSGVKGNRYLEADLADLTPKERGTVTRVLADASTGTASNLERKAIAKIRRALGGSVEVEANGMVRGYCFDIVIRKARVLIEIDSYRYHGAESEYTTEEAFIRDRWKGNMATRWGWKLLRYTDTCVNTASDYMAEEVADTVRFELRRLRRHRREDEAIRTDTPLWHWYPGMQRVAVAKPGEPVMRAGRNATATRPVPRSTG